MHAYSYLKYFYIIFFFIPLIKCFKENHAYTLIKAPKFLFFYIKDRVQDELQGFKPMPGLFFLTCGIYRVELQRDKCTQGWVCISRIPKFD